MTLPYIAAGYCMAENWVKQQHIYCTDALCHQQLLVVVVPLPRRAIESFLRCRIRLP